MKYDEQSLSILWNLIKNHKSPRNSNFLGLREVPFEKDIIEFMNDYEMKSFKCHYTKKTKTSININETIKELKNKNIGFHHLSCAAEKNFFKNAALCIHYRENNVNHSISLPGVTYIPSEETLKIYLNKENDALYELIK